LIGTPGVSLAASVGLTIGATDETALPLTAWGTGTRRLAALEIAALGVSGDSIALIDEPETGLEPYRHRVFVNDLAGDGHRQTFVTTHATAVLSSGRSKAAVVWRMTLPEYRETQSDAPDAEETQAAEFVRPSHVLTELKGDELKRIAKEQPEALLARLPMVVSHVVV
jgi:ABC-type transporter Mla maintaining outer membrane lipid asymmetry ATPase subunit MlaF